MKLNTIVALALAAAVSSPVSAADNTILVTHGQGRGAAHQAAIDLQSSGEASAFQFGIQLPKGAKNIDVSGCLKALPSSHTGTCQADEKSGRVAVVVFSADNTTLPAGMLGLGEIKFQASSKGEISLDKIVLASPSGQKSLSATGRVESIDAPRNDRSSRSEK